MPRAKLHLPAKMRPPLSITLRLRVANIAANAAAVTVRYVDATVIVANAVAASGMQAREIP